MILLFGPTGAGKSVQGKMLAARKGWQWISTGELLRQNADDQTIEMLKTGELISDNIIYKVFEKAIGDIYSNGDSNFIIDGFPRNKNQAEWFSDYIKKSGKQIDIVVVLEVPDSEIMTRLEKRNRMEDTPETIMRRMNIYRQKMYPVLGILADAGARIVHLDGTGTVGEVHDRIYSEVKTVCQD